MKIAPIEKGEWSARMQHDLPQTTLIIPALNEGAVIGQVVRDLLACDVLRRLAPSGTGPSGSQTSAPIDILVIDNGSTDDTAAEALAAGARVIHEARRGYGYACAAGVAAAGADIIIQLDGDGSDVPEDIIRVWELVQSGQADLAVGSRVRGHVERGALTVQQRVGNALGAVLLRGLYGVHVSDLGPLRAIRRSTILRMEMQEMTYGWSVEMLAKAGRLGLRVAEIPVDYRQRAGGVSKVSGTFQGTLRASYRILRTLSAYTRWQPSGLPADLPLAADLPPDAGWPGAGPRPVSRATPPPSALFIVARLPIVGQTKTRLGRSIGPEAATALYCAFLKDLATRFSAAAAEDGYDLWWYFTAPVEQTGSREPEAGSSAGWPSAAERSGAAGLTAASSAGPVEEFARYVTPTELGWQQHVTTNPSRPTLLHTQLPFDRQRLMAGTGTGTGTGTGPPGGPTLGRLRRHAVPRLTLQYSASTMPKQAYFLLQGPGDFGTRLWQGFRKLSARGYERVMVISSDTPHISAQMVRDAFAALATHEVVIGPADDGGYCLLGQRGRPRDLFTMVPMSTSAVFAQTVRVAAELGVDVAQTPQTFDIDTLADLQRLADLLATDPTLAPATWQCLKTRWPAGWPDAAGRSGAADWSGSSDSSGAAGGTLVTDGTILAMDHPGSSQLDPLQESHHDLV